jgi:hypothetical protein
VDGITYRCRADKWGNKQKDSIEREIRSNRGAPGTTQRREVDRSVWRTARDARKRVKQIKRAEQEGKRAEQEGNRAEITVSVERNEEIVEEPGEIAISGEIAPCPP